MHLSGKATLVVLCSNSLYNKKSVMTWHLHSKPIKCIGENQNDKTT